MLEAEGIRLTFPDREKQAFVGLELARFAPAAGAMTAVAGPSGSGKSTLLYVLAGLLAPQKGRVLYRGHDIFALDEGGRDAWRRRTVGFVFQDFHLIPELSIVANVTLPATFGGMTGDRARARSLLDRLKVPVDRRSVDELSRGERQRVAIARALAFDPPVILADEPTASLDDAAGVEVQAILRGLAAEGRTVVSVTHDPALVAAADATLRLEHGRALAHFDVAAE